MNHTYIWISERSFIAFSFLKGITGIRFAEHQRCYIRAQTKKLPAVAEVETEDREPLVQYASTRRLSAALQRLSCILLRDNQSAALWAPRVNPQPVHLLLSPHPSSLKDCGACETARKLTTSPWPLCGSHQMVLAVNLEPILIFNHFFQRLNPNSLKGGGCQTEVWERGKPLKWYF